MKIVAFAPIKLRNERLPGKNTKPFTNGLPLCQYLFRTLLQVECLNEVYAFCSDKAICGYLPDEVIWLPRDPRLDDDDARGIDIVKVFTQAVDADIYVLTHVTSPFLSAESIHRGIVSVTDEGHDSAFSVVMMHEFLWMDGTPLNYDPARIPRTQDLPPIYMETSGFYIYRKEVVLNQGRRIGCKPKMIEVSKIEAMDIDNPIDFTIADAVHSFLFAT